MKTKTEAHKKAGEPARSFLKLTPRFASSIRPFVFSLTTVELQFAQDVVLNGILCQVTIILSGDARQSGLPPSSQDKHHSVPKSARGDNPGTVPFTKMSSKGRTEL